MASFLRLIQTIQASMDMQTHVERLQGQPEMLRLMQNEVIKDGLNHVLQLGTTEVSVSLRVSSTENGNPGSISTQVPSEGDLLTEIIAFIDHEIPIERRPTLLTVQMSAFDDNNRVSYPEAMNAEVTLGSIRYDGPTAPPEPEIDPLPRFEREDLV